MEIKKITTPEEIKKALPLFLSVMTQDPYRENWNQESALRELSEIFDNGKGYCFYAQENKEVIGLIFSRIESWEEGTHLIIEYIVVDPKMRKNGVGSALFKATEDSAKFNSISHMHLISHRQAMAKEFWEKHGFEMKGVIEMSKSI